MDRAKISLISIEEKHEYLYNYHVKGKYLSASAPSVRELTHTLKESSQGNFNLTQNG